MNVPAGAPPDPKTPLQFIGVGKAFRVGARRTNALGEVSLSLQEGAVSALVGPDGAGKTTLLRLAAGLLLPDRGRVLVFGMDTAGAATPIHALIGYMPQRFGLYEDLTVDENLNLHADLQGLRPAARRAHFESLTRMTGLLPFGRRLAGKLSGGMKQKLGLACTLVSRPRLLLLDEPTVGVDPVSRRELWAIIDRLVAESAVTVLLSTAYLDEAQRCAEVIMLDQGRVIGQGPPQDFMAGMAGRCFAVSALGLRTRELQARLSAAPGVVDAVIQGDRVRLVTETAGPQAALAFLPSGETIGVEAVDPRFEDAFIALLRQRRGGAPLSAVTPPAPAAACVAEAVIEVEEAERRFGDFQAVQKLSFSVRRGEVFGLLGANGAGKTTTFRMLCGLLPPSGGRLSVAGLNMRTAAGAARARIGYMSQKFSLYGHLSVRQNLEFFGRVYGLGRSVQGRRIQWALEEFSLKTLQDVDANDLALGYKQRLAMACALMHEPEIIFLDEPTSGVDPLTRREFWNRTNRLADAGVTVLVTTHFMEEAEHCDRLLIMAAGAILAEGAPDRIKDGVRRPGEPRPTLEEAFVRLVKDASRAGTA